jgi:hypothetical protein
MALPRRDAGTGVHVYCSVLSIMKHGFTALYHPAAHPQLRMYYQSNGGT